jgi:4-hydroxy-2-oxoheptanedioate aldolase
MRPNPLKRAFAEGKGLINGWLHIPSSVATEAMAHQGFDSLTIDMQHGLAMVESAIPMLQAMATTDVTPMARVPWNEPGIIMKMLDLGCYGIICPMVNSRAECEAFVGACRYPPLGYRSFGPTRVKMVAGADYAAHANDEILTLAMIETAEAMENLEDIASTPGLDGLYVGPADLSQSLGGKPGADFEDGPIPEALDTILKVAKANNLVAGLHNGSAAYARKMLDKGFQLVTVQSDLAFMSQAAAKVVQDIQGGPQQDTFKQDASPY